MYEKLDKLRDEVRRATKKKKDADLRLKTAQEKLREAENSQILSDVGALNMTPEQVAQFLKMAASGKLPKVKPDGTIEGEDDRRPEDRVSDISSEREQEAESGESLMDSDDTVALDDDDSEDEKGEDRYV
ncbi:MAG: DUF4315 family protein [Eubacterium sp.]